MEINVVNFRFNSPNNNDLQTNAPSIKDNKSDFSKVYKDVSSKASDDASQEKVQVDKETLTNDVKSTAASNDSEGKKIESSNLEKTDDGDEKTKDEKRLNKLVELLLLSGNTNQNLVALLKSSDGDTKEIKDLLLKLLNGSLNDETSLKGNAINLSPITKGEKSSNSEILKLLANKEGLNQSIEKLASKIADKFVTDKDFKANLLSKLQEQKPESDAETSAALKQLIIGQLKPMVNTKSSENEMKLKELKSLIRNGLLNQNQETENKSIPTVDDAKLKGNNTNTFKLGDNSSSKEDTLLKQLTDKDSNKNSKDNVSDKIANVVNRFEVIRTDKAEGAEGKVVINRATLNADFIKAVKFMDMNNLKELSVKVLPKDLGEIVIRLSMDNGVMKASITAANKDTYNLLNSQLPAISNQLAEQNMNIQNFSLSLSNGENFLFSGDGSPKDNGKQQGNGNSKIEGIEDLDMQKEMYTEETNSVNILA